MRPKEIVYRFLASMGRPDVNKQYLELFQAERKESFAFVIITPAAQRDSGNAVVSDLIFLSELELTPVLCVESEAQATRLQAKLPKELRVDRCALVDVPSTTGIPLLVAESPERRCEMIRELQSRKVVYLIAQSGLQPLGQKVRSLINLSTDYRALVSDSGLRLRAEQAALLTEVREVFEGCNHTFTVSLTSAQDLLRELFTIKGAGTLVRRGTKVQQFSAYADLDQDKFAALLSSAFGRMAKSELFSRPALTIYLASDYQGAAVLESTRLAPYLSKFAVEIRAQGEGLGGDLWNALTGDHPRFFWRSRPNNPIAAWYSSQCNGLVRCDDWTVYWRGLQISEISQAVDLASSAPLDFGEST